MVHKPIANSQTLALFEKILEFNHARGWHPHPHDLAKSIVIEAAELLELFQWDVSDKKLGTKLTDKNIDDVEKELVDVLWYVISFCHESKIDLNKALVKKIAHNAKKYPADQFNGHHNDEFYKKRKTEYRQDRK